MALLQSIEDKQFAANVKMLREEIQKLVELQKINNELLKQQIEALTPAIKMVNSIYETMESKENVRHICAPL